MTPFSFEAQIQNGQVVPGDSFRQFEGRRVRITIDSPPTSSAVPMSEEMVPGEEMDIEKDVYVKIPFATREELGSAEVQTTSLAPSVIVPEELSDD